MRSGPETRPGAVILGEVFALELVVREPHPGQSNGRISVLLTLAEAGCASDARGNTQANVSSRNLKRLSDEDQPTLKA